MKKFLSILLAAVMLFGLAVPAFAKEITDDYRTFTTDDEDYEVMGYKYSNGIFKIYGKFDKEWKQVSYSDRGFQTIVKIGENTYTLSLSGQNCVYDETANEYIIENTLAVSLDFEFTNEGQTIKVNYSVRNLTEEEVTYSISTHDDIQIGSDDTAKITVFEDGKGFKMVSDYRSDGKNLDDEDPDNDEYAQFNFFQENADGFWFGNYSERSYNYFNSYETNEAIVDGSYSGDSGCTWFWKDRVVSASGENTHHVLLGIGGKGSEDVVGGPEVVVDEITKVPEALAEEYENIEVIKDELGDAFADKFVIESEEDAVTVFFKEATLVQEVNGNKIIVTPENFPEDGVDVVFKWADIGIDPEEKDNYKFVIAHLVSSTANGATPGVIEIFEDNAIEKTDAGLKIHVYSLSPFAIAYQAKPTETPVPNPAPNPEPESEPDEIIIDITGEQKAEDETNPNTGAPVLAPAVIVFAAAAVLLKRK